MDIMKLIDSEKIRVWRRHMHKYPEVGFNERETSNYIAAEIAANFPDVELIRFDDKVNAETFPNYGLIAVLKGGKPGKALAMRADFDALPMKEDTDLEFKSVHENVAHTCGHDCHAAMLLGAMDALYKIKDELEGHVLFIFQHAEEALPGGAQAIIDSGVFKDYDIKAFYASHVFPSDKVGVIKFSPGSVTANSDLAGIEIEGKGGHGSMPEKCIDTVLVGTEVVQALNYIVSRNVSAFNNAVISIGRFSAGTVANIIPHTAEIMVTVRSRDSETRDLIERRINEITQNICAAYGATCKVEYKRGYTSIINDDDLCKTFSNIVAETLPDLEIKANDPLMGGEDFSAFKAIAPTLFVGLGAMPASGEFYVNHHPKFEINEDVLPLGTALYVAFATKM